MANDDIKSEIIRYIRRNRVSSTEVADCLGKSGALTGLKPVNRGHFVVGNLFWTYVHGNTNWQLHERIQNVEEGDIVLTEVFDCGDRAAFGDIVSKYLILYRQAAGLAVTGNLRDASRLIKENWPIWCRGYNPVGCFNRPPEHDLEPSVHEEHIQRYHGAIAVCDDTGVVVIPRDRHNAEFIERLEFIEAQEDIWYECIDRRKWSTFDAICKRRYLDDEGE